MASEISDSSVARMLNVSLSVNSNAGNSGKYKNPLRSELPKDPEEWQPEQIASHGHEWLEAISKRAQARRNIVNSDPSPNSAS